MSALQLRLVVEALDYDQAVTFYRDVLGLPELVVVSGSGGAQVIILDAGRATLELANRAQKRFIDEVEGAMVPAPRIRVAFEVADTVATAGVLAGAGGVDGDAVPGARRRLTDRQ